jgi:hypothetical protein
MRQHSKGTCYFRKLEGFKRSPAGLEWQIWQRLPDKSWALRLSYAF